MGDVTCDIMEKQFWKITIYESKRWVKDNECVGHINFDWSGQSVVHP